MDSRATLNVKATFIEILKEAHQSDTKVHLMIDDNGLMRAEGFIDAISTDSVNPHIELDGGRKIEIQKIVAVNGIFLPEYAEC